MLKSTTCSLIVGLSACFALTTPLVAQERLLQISGRPYFDGDVTVHVSAPDAVGSPTVLAYGLDPLENPVQIGIKGPWYIGQLFKLLNLGSIPAGGRIDLPLTMPPEEPMLAGLPVVMQAFVPPYLSNPAIVRLDLQYLTPSNAVEVLPPMPLIGAKFGDPFAAGDFDDDGEVDLAVSASNEDYLGIESAGSVYVLWGPDHTTFTVLRPPHPGNVAAFGRGLAAADYNQDGKDDLGITQNVPDPPTPTDVGRVYVCWGTDDRQLAVQFVSSSPNSGLAGAGFGRHPASGDVTDDGIPDLVVGAPFSTTNGTPFGGAIMILPGPTLDQTWVIPNPTPVGGDLFGDEILVRDMDGDGNLDIVDASERADVLDPQTQIPVVNAGEINVGYGPDFLTWVAISNPMEISNMNRFGQSVTAADLDGDGLLEIGTSDNDNRAFILWGDGSPSTQMPKPPSLFQNPFGDSSYGYSSLFKDANGDGLDDLLIGDPFDGSEESCAAGSSGVIWAALAPHFTTFTIIEPLDTSCGDAFGWPLLIADVDGDGVGDLVVGSDLTDTSAVPNSGRLIYFPGGQ